VPNASATVSVVIPCYNSSRFVPVAVASALAQSVAVHEVIVVDDGSTDDPAAALVAIDDPRLRVVRIENRGVAHARNLGAQLASGEYLAFLDADDAWYPTKLERQLARFGEEPQPVAVGAQMHHVGSRGAAVGITGERDLGDDRQQLVRAARLMPFAISSSVVSRAAFHEVGGFDESLHQAEDLDFVARLATRGPLRIVGEPLGTYRVHADSASARHYRLQRQGTRFVRERLSVREAGGELTWQGFVAARPRSSAREWVDDTARSLYRSAGVLAAERRYLAAGWRLGASALLQPPYVIRRLRQQRAAGFARGGGRDGAH